MKTDGFLTPIEFSRYVLKFKFVHLSYIFLLFYLIKFVLFKENLFLKKDFYILVSLVAFSIILIFHQLLSLNQKFIELIVPILLGFSHIYLEKSKNLNDSPRGSSAGIKKMTNKVVTSVDYSAKARSQGLWLAPDLDHRSDSSHVSDDVPAFGANAAAAN